VAKAASDAPDPSRLSDLGDLQLAVMQVLWQRGAASVHEVLAQLPSDPAPAYTTILTVLRNLERRGLVTHDPVPGARMFQYRPLILAHEACTDRLQDLLCRWYDSSPVQLIKHVLLIADLSAEERDEIRQLLDDV
jgi:predicted transcriptional regulator